MTLAFLLARRFAESFAAGLLAGIVFLVMAPVAIGWRPYTVLTGSMRPGIQPGDVVMDRPIAVSAMHVGDVVTFSDPTRGGKLVTHRVRSIARGPQFTTVETRGDANNTSERWQVATREQVGRVVFVLPKIGKVAVLVRNPAGILLLVVLPVLGLGFLALRSIWRDDDEADDDADEDAEPDALPKEADNPTPAGDPPVGAAPVADASGGVDR
jgi:signal peptidase I